MLLIRMHYGFVRRLVRACANTAVLVALVSGVAQAQVLTVHLIGNAGVVLTDGHTSLLIDLPYEPGAFGYMHYDPALLQPDGDNVSVITHNHRDHFDPSLFVKRRSWRIIGPPSVTAGVPPDRVLTGDSVVVGAFSVVGMQTPHTPDHRSYRVRWRGRVLHFTGDTDQASALPPEPYLDVLFVTPWLQCSLRDSDWAVSWSRAILYHRQPNGSDEICGSAEPLEQGARFTLTAR
jgi:glyoxylase-like metal-dependent hydrolase (beta-lactamase superfamily II)